MKLYHWLVVGLYGLFNCAGYAQFLIPLDETQYRISLEQLLNESNNNSDRFERHLFLSEFWAIQDSITSKKHLSKAEKIAQYHPHATAYLAYYKGIYLANNAKTSLAKKEFETAIRYLTPLLETKQKKRLAEVWYHYGYVQIADKGYANMVGILTEHCIPLALEINDDELLAFYYTQLGLTFMSVAQFEKAEQQHLKALEVLQKIPKQDIVHLQTYFNLVSNYCYKADSQTAKIYLDKAEDIIKKHPDSYRYTRYYYQSGLLYTTKTDYAQAKIELEKGIETAKKHQQLELLQMLKFRFYNIYMMQSDFLKAKALLENIVEEKVLTREPLNRRITYTELAKVNDALGNYREAYAWLEKSAILSDSLQNANLFEKMNELEIVHQSAEKQKTIDQLNREKTETELLAKNNQLRITILATALALLFIIAGLIYVYYINQRKLNRQIQINHQQQLLQIENERRYEATQALLTGEEQERQRIAQDLHDSMGGMLASIRMSLSQTNQAIATQDIVPKIDKAIVEMRRISRNLMPETLKNLGLQTALKELCHAMSHPNLQIHYAAFDLSDQVPFPTQLALYRVVQEAISNVLKHAQASEIVVQISQNEKWLYLTIEDDGIGFDPSSAPKGMGLKNIQNRVRLINGKLEISSCPNEGTTLNIECYAY